MVDDGPVVEGDHRSIRRPVGVLDVDVRDLTKVTAVGGDGVETVIGSGGSWGHERDPAVAAGDWLGRYVRSDVTERLEEASDRGAGDDERDHRGSDALVAAPSVAPARDVADACSRPGGSPASHARGESRDQASVILPELLSAERAWKCSARTVAARMPSMLPASSAVY